MFLRIVEASDPSRGRCPPNSSKLGRWGEEMEIFLSAWPESLRWAWSLAASNSGLSPANGRGWRLGQSFASRGSQGAG